MKVLFLHQNAPGQFKHLAPALAADPRNAVTFITKRQGITLPNIRILTYQPQRAARAETHHYVRLLENGVLHGQQVVRLCQDLAREGYRPDLIVAHPGWGESLFAKDVFPHTPLLNYAEFYYQGRGADIGYDPATPATMDDICRARIRNAHLLLSLESCDRALSPTRWQKSRHPPALQPKIEVIFDGIDTAALVPAAPAAPMPRVRLPDGTLLARSDQVVTYVARNLEPYRGFPQFMRALPPILAACPHAHILVVGGDEVSYGHAAPDGGTWRQHMLAEIGGLDPQRVHFLGKLPYAQYLAALHVATVHVYLTMPFVLSWSLMEALALGTVVVASDTAPVREVIEDGRNGLLVDLLRPERIAARVVDVLRDRAQFAHLKPAARRTIEDAYALRDCLPRQVRLLQDTAMSR